MRIPDARLVKRTVLLLATIALSACATPEVERTATFNQVRYDADLTICRGSNEFEAVAKGAGGMVGGLSTACSTARRRALVKGTVSKVPR